VTPLTVGVQAVLQQPGQPGAGAEAGDEDGARAEDALHCRFAGGGVQRLARRLDVAAAFVQRGGEHLGHRRRLRQVAAHALDRRQQGFEAANQLGTEVGIAVEAERTREAVGGGHRHAGRRREFVDRQRRDLQRALQHVVGHLAVRARQLRQRLRDALRHGGGGRGRHAVQARPFTVRMM